MRGSKIQSRLRRVARLQLTNEVLWEPTIRVAPLGWRMQPLVVVGCGRLHVKRRIGRLAEAMIMDGVKDFYEWAAQWQEGSL